MKREHIPISALPAWCKLNDVTFLDTAVLDLGSKGYGLITERALSSENTYDIPSLLLIPHDLVLSAESIEEYAKVDHHLRELLDIVGGKSLRRDFMLFLLMQITITSPGSHSVGLSNPWTEFVKMLPDQIPVPTLWTEEERLLLVGTSLESALTAKMAALTREFEELKEKTAELSWCQKCWLDNENLEFSDWLLVDAWYRSRCLELPISGQSMVPALDMANHSSNANSYYEQTSSSGVSLLLRPGVKMDNESEITISYGASKSEAEMLFSYGFIEEQNSTAELVLNLEPFPDDPLGKAKTAAFKEPPIVRITEAGGTFRWDSPFLYLMCLNEEDGLEFRVLQQTDGSRSALRVFWQDVDVTQESSSFEVLIGQHELKDVFELRVVALLQDRIRQQLERLYESEETILSLAHTALITSDRRAAAFQLRGKETKLLEDTFASTELQKNELLKSESVLRYLGSMEMEVDDETLEQVEEDDFS